MYKKQTWVTTLFLWVFGSLQAQTPLTPFVNPLVGTAASTTPASLKHGEGTELLANTIPAVGLPLGMTQWVAQTRQGETKCIAPYYYKDSVFTGFRGTHWLSGSCVQDYGTTSVMPILGKLKTRATDYAVPFTHAKEVSKPHYYALELPQARLKTEMTATLRCGMLKITALATDTLYLLIAPNSNYNRANARFDAARQTVLVENKVHRIYQGWGQAAGFSGYAAVQFDRKAAIFGSYTVTQSVMAQNALKGGVFPKKDTVSNQANMGIYVGFALKKGDVLTVKIGTSFTGTEGALKNLAQEIPHFDFSKTLISAEKSWEDALSTIIVEGSAKEKQIFYTALFHALQHPRLYNDVDGLYPVFAGNYQNARLAEGDYYDDFSMWDIYRAQLPLLEIIRPQVVNDLVRSLILKGEQGGWIPNFPCWNSYTSAMVGDHAAPFIASAYNKGIRQFDAEKAYFYLRKNAFEQPDSAQYKDGRGRRALNSYLKYNYYPLEDSVNDAFHRKEQVSRTLEYAYDDYCVGTLANALGKKDDAAIFAQRGQNYRNVFDPSVGFANGRYADGRFLKNFNPDKKLFFITEGTSRQYTFYAPHDVAGLMGLFGGKKKFEQQLDSIFEKKEYWHGNEPGHQIPFLYTFTDAPHKSDERVHQLMATEYGAGIGGLSGNDDAGQMSAWYVFAAMGFYPVNPASDEYALTLPLFPKITIKTGVNTHATIVCEKKTPKSKRIESIRKNTTPLSMRTLKHQDLMEKNTIRYELAD